MKRSLTRKTAGIFAVAALAIGLVSTAASTPEAESSSPQALLMICNGNNLC